MAAEDCDPAGVERTKIIDQDADDHESHCQPGLLEEAHAERYPVTEDCGACQLINVGVVCRKLSNGCKASRQKHQKDAENRPRQGWKDQESALPSTQERF